MTDSIEGGVGTISDQGDGNPLDPNETWTYEKIGVVLDLPTEVGPNIVPNVCTQDGAQTPGRNAYTNEGTVMVPGATDSDPDSYCNPPPDIKIVKKTNGVDANDPDAAGVPELTPGDPVTWTYEVMNIGPVAIDEADITVTDSIEGGVGTISDQGDGNPLDPNETWTYEKIGVVLDLPTEVGPNIVPNVCTQDGAQTPGRNAYTNEGTVMVPGATDSDPDSYCNPPPDIKIVKKTNGVDANDPDAAGVPELTPGDPVTWTYEVMNIGPVAIDETDITVTDSIEGGVGTISDQGDGNPLDPNETWTYEKIGVVLDLPTEVGLNIVPDVCTQDGAQTPGRNAYTNEGTVMVPGATDSDPDSYCNPQPQIDIEKVSTGAPNDNPTAPDEDNEDSENGLGVPVLPPGATVTWTYRVTNTGVVTIPLADVTVTDSVAGVNPVRALPDFVGNDDNDLEPAEEWKFEATGVVLNLGAEILGGEIVTGCENIPLGAPGRNTYENNGTVTVPGDTDSDLSHYCNPTGMITIIKDTVPDQGQDFSYTTTGGLVPPAFDLDDDTDGTLPNTQVYSSLAAGSYSTTETLVGNFATGLACNVDVAGAAPGSSFMVMDETADITLTSGGEVTCTYTNSGFLLVECPVFPDGMVGVLYSEDVPASGGSGNYQFSTFGGTGLPPGLSIDPSFPNFGMNFDPGTISGIPSMAGDFDFFIQVLDDIGTPAAQSPTACPITIEGLPPELLVEKTPDGGVFNQGDQVSFDIVVSNPAPPGSETAMNVQLTDNLPGNGGLMWTSAVPSQGFCGAIVANLLNCFLGSIAPQNSATVTVTSTLLTPPEACQLQPNTATATADGELIDDDTGSLICTPPPPPATLEVIKVLSPETDLGKFNLQIDNVTFAPDAGHLDTTGPQIVSAGQHFAGETAGTGTNLADYTSEISGDCSPIDGSVTLLPGDIKTCTITNTRKPGVCWMTGGGGKYVQLEDGSMMADTTRRFNYGGNVFPSCDLNGGMGGNWNFLDQKNKLHLKGKAIQMRSCGNVPGIPPGSTSPATPFNFIEFMGTGSLKGIKGNKTNEPSVFFIARAEDRNEPGTPGPPNTNLNDRFFIQVYTNPADIEGSTLVFLNVENVATTDADRLDLTDDTVAVTNGNLQIHISSCN